MNVLSKEKQQIVIGSLAEGASIRSTERFSGIHGDTIMRLGVHTRDTRPDREGHRRGKRLRRIESCHAVVS